MRRWDDGAAAGRAVPGGRPGQLAVARRLREPVLIGLAATAGAAVFILSSVLSAAPTGTADADAAAAYAATVQDVALAAGAILEMELKPGITDLREQAFPDDVLRGFSDRWADDLGTLHDRLVDVPVPAGGDEAHALLLDALDRYRDVALILSGASEFSGHEREAALQRAIQLGRAADQAWNRARDLLAEHLRAVGLDPSLWLPVPTT